MANNEHDPCVGGPNASLYRCPGCDGQIDQYITMDEIPVGNGVCVDKACYDRNQLAIWLQHNARVPHNNRAMTPADFAAHQNDNAPNNGCIPAPAAGGAAAAANNYPDWECATCENVVNDGWRAHCAVCGGVNAAAGEPGPGPGGWHCPTCGGETERGEAECEDCGAPYPGPAAADAAPYLGPATIDCPPGCHVDGDTMQCVDDDGSGRYLYGRGPTRRWA